MNSRGAGAAFFSTALILPSSSSFNSLARPSHHIFTLSPHPLRRLAGCLPCVSPHWSCSLAAALTSLNAFRCLAQGLDAAAAAADVSISPRFLACSAISPKFHQVDLSISSLFSLPSSLLQVFIDTQRTCEFQLNLSPSLLIAWVRLRCRWTEQSLAVQSIDWHVWNRCVGGRTRVPKRAPSTGGATSASRPVKEPETLLIHALCRFFFFLSLTCFRRLSVHLHRRLVFQ